jgi:hypothetical protein
VIDRLVTDDDLARIAAASRRLPRRVTPAEVRHALALLVLSRTGAIEQVRSGACKDGGSSSITGYLLAHDGKGMAPLLLEEEQCHVLLKENASRAARELTHWVHHLRGTATPYR